MEKTRGFAAAITLAVVLAFGAGLYIGISNELRGAWAANSLILHPDQEPDVELAPLWTAWNVLSQAFVDTTASTSIPTNEEKLYGAIKGLTESYDDPYTVFLPPAEAKEFQENISGAFEGVGMELGVRDGTLTVVAPLKNSPAERAGLRTGDKVLAIDGKSTENMAVDAAVKIIRGPKGTKVNLRISREGSEPFDVSIVRDTIQIPIINTVEHSNGVFEISVYSFSANSTALFRDALRDFVSSGSDKLLLDLRGNPGGYLEAAVQMASFFLPVGEVVVTEDFEGNADNVLHRSVGYNVFAGRDLKMAVLVNGGSASASEILAGALREHGVATLVGETTFGKGSVQELVDLGGGAQLKVTIARWLTPKGTSISDGGLTPDIVVSMTPEDAQAARDPQKDKAIEWLLSQ